MKNKTKELEDEIIKRFQESTCKVCKLRHKKELIEEVKKMIDNKINEGNVNIYDLYELKKELNDILSQPKGRSIQ